MVLVVGQGTIYTHRHISQPGLYVGRSGLLNKGLPLRASQQMKTCFLHPSVPATAAMSSVQLVKLLLKLPQRFDHIAAAVTST